MVVQGLQERSRQKIMDGLRRFIMVDNMESRKVVKPKITTDSPEAVVRGGSGGTDSFGR